MVFLSRGTRDELRGPAAYLGRRLQNDLFVQQLDYHLHMAFFGSQVQAVESILWRVRHRDSEWERNLPTRCGRRKGA